MADVVVASAVEGPDPESTESPTVKGTKRRHSVISEQEEESKRHCTSEGKNSSPPAAEDVGSDKQDPPTKAPTDNEPAERRAVHQKSNNINDDKQRTKRLFGALLGNLSQPSDRISKRRLEIEARRKAELQRQDDERLGNRQRRLEKLTEKRKIEQKKLDEQNMRLRHRNMLNTANFLQTIAEPKLFYRPWDLRPDEEARVDEQIKVAHAEIDKELETRHRIERKASGEALGRPETDRETTVVISSDVNDDKIEKVHNGVPADTKARSTATGSIASEAQGRAKSNDEDDAQPAEIPESDHVHTDTNPEVEPVDSLEKMENTPDAINDAAQEDDEDGEHVVDGDEDTVIY